MTNKHKTEWEHVAARVAGNRLNLTGLLLAARVCVASPAGDHPIPRIFDPRSTPADALNQHSHFVLAITGLIFVVVFTLLTYAILKFRQTTENADREPAQVYGSTQIELAWTIIPILIVVVLFLAVARVIHAVQDAPKPPTAVEA